jgi:Ca2+-binding EF-hand superfamily protein
MRYSVENALLYLVSMVLFIATLGVAQAVAASHEDTAMRAFSALDGDGDGFVTEQEAAMSAVVGANFATVDVNRDGRLSLDEYGSWLAGATGGEASEPAQETPQD